RREGREPAAHGERERRARRGQCERSVARRPADEVDDEHDLVEGVAVLVEVASPGLELARRDEPEVAVARELAWLGHEPDVRDGGRDVAGQALFGASGGEERRGGEAGRDAGGALEHDSCRSGSSREHSRGEGGKRGGVLRSEGDGWAAQAHALAPGLDGDPASAREGDHPARNAVASSSKALRGRQGPSAARSARPRNAFELETTAASACVPRLETPSSPRWREVSRERRRIRSARKKWKRANRARERWSLLCMKQRTRQREFGFVNWGGKRRGAGRKPMGERAGVTHAKRPRLAARFPVLVTLRMRSGLPSMRERSAHELVRSAFAAASGESFRVIEYSVLSNHVHVLAEAKDERALSRGMMSLGVRIARGLNRMWRRAGNVLQDRYHARILRTPRAVRTALIYVIQNARKHDAWRALVPDWFSSGVEFEGWKGTKNVAESRPRLLERARTWLLSIGWKRHGLIDLREAPVGSPG